MPLAHVTWDNTCVHGSVISALFRALAETRGKAAVWFLAIPPGGLSGHAGTVCCGVQSGDPARRGEETLRHSAVR